MSYPPAQRRADRTINALLCSCGNLDALGEACTGCARIRHGHDSPKGWRLPTASRHRPALCANCQPRRRGPDAAQAGNLELELSERGSPGSQAPGAWPRAPVLTTRAVVAGSSADIVLDVRLRDRHATVGDAARADCLSGPGGAARSPVPPMLKPARSARRSRTSCGHRQGALGKGPLCGGHRPGLWGQLPSAAPPPRCGSPFRAALGVPSPGLRFPGNAKARSHGSPRPGKPSLDASPRDVGPNDDDMSVPVSPRVVYGTATIVPLPLRGGRT